jgi:hypothetical protein
MHTFLTTLILYKEAKNTSARQRGSKYCVLPNHATQATHAIKAASGSALGMNIIKFSPRLLPLI